VYISCKSLTVYFSLQVKNKPNGGIAFPAFILGAGVVKKQSSKNYTNKIHCSYLQRQQAGEIFPLISHHHDIAEIRFI
jgi:hypothetical protein